MSDQLSGSRTTGDRAALAALAVGSVIGVLVPAVLQQGQAISRDEVSTMAAIQPDRWRQLQARLAASSDRLPEAYYDLAWLLKPVTGGGLTGTRTISVVAWGAAGVLLGVIVLRRGWRWPAVLVASTVPTACGLASMGSYARPYALAFAAFCGCLACWDASRRRVRVRHVVGVVVLGSAAVALHLAMAFALGIVFVVELVRAVRRSRVRGWAMTIALAVSAWPVLAVSRSASGTIDAIQALPMTASPSAAPRWYLSTVGPLAPAVVVAAIVVGLLWLRAGTPPGRAAVRRSVRREIQDPLVQASALLGGALPLVVVLGSRIAGLSYLHRYAIGGVAGLALLTSLATAVIDRRARSAAAVVALAVVACVPLTLVRAMDDRPSPTRVHDLVEELGLDRTEGPIVVDDAYLLGLLRGHAPEGVAARAELGGPSDVIGLEPSFPLDDVADGTESEPEPFTVVLERGDLALLLARGGLVQVATVGSGSLRYQTVDRELVAVEVRSRTE